MAPEGIASLISRPMIWLSRSTRPPVWLLSASSSLLLRLTGVRQKEEPPVTDDEIKVLMEQGAEAGVFHESEQAIVANVLRLDEQRIESIMTPRKDIYLIDLNEPDAEIRRSITESSYTRIIVCRDGLDHIVGILRTSDLLKAALEGEPLDVGRKTRCIPPALRRALASRDKGCVFPGCSHKRYVDGHHVEHWADGGETKLSNLATLCGFHP